MNKNLTVGVIVMLTLVTVGTTVMQSANAVINSLPNRLAPVDHTIDAARKAPVATSGDNTYIAWWTNRTGNDEVNFRASTDGGATFADKINLSNSTDAESQDVEIAADGESVIITWWERNQTAEEPVLRMSSDNGATFGPLLKLAANGTIGETTEEG